MPYYKTCPSCGAHLDPGELCDCEKKVIDAYRTASPDVKAKVIAMIEETAPSAANTESGKAESEAHIPLLF